MTATVVCSICKEAIRSDAQKCPHCAEWLVPTHGTGASEALTILGWAWLVVSAFGALILTDDKWGRVGWPIVIAVLAQGIVAGVLMLVIAQLGPRQPQATGSVEPSDQTSLANADRRQA